MITGLLPDTEIQALCNPEDWPGLPMVSELLEKQGHPSFGLEPYGVTVRLGRSLFRQTHELGRLIGGESNEDQWTKHKELGKYIALKPLETILAETVETFNIPDDISGQCTGKSTYARMGLFVNTTPLEPGWKGVLTLELTNLSQNKILYLVINQGIAQIQFTRGYKPRTTYKGLYQYQTGVTLAR